MMDSKQDTPSEATLENPADVKVAQQPEVEPKAKSKLEDFANSSHGAKLSGKVHQAKGFFTRKMGEWTDDVEMKKAGRDEQLLGQIHSIVGGLREVREVATKKTQQVKTDGEVILKKHGEKLLDQAVEFLDDVKKTFF